MKAIDLHTGAARIRHGLQEVLRVWEESGESWDDGVRRKFFEERLEPIVPVVKNTLDAAARMQALLAEAQRDVQD